MLSSRYPKRASPTRCNHPELLHQPYQQPRRRGAGILRGSRLENSTPVSLIAGFSLYKQAMCFIFIAFILLALQHMVPEGTQDAVALEKIQEKSN